MTFDAIKPSDDGRAWVEVDLNALAHNTVELSSLLPQSCKLMAVVKADAYGHGAQAVASLLQREGVSAFAVATVYEGAQLRQSGIKGEILVLGYTHPKDARMLSAYNLSQLAVDGAYAQALDKLGHNIRVHVAIDTGMHRLGIEPANLSEIESVFKCKNLTVEATASHLAVPDSLEPGDIEFTSRQVESFFNVLSVLKRKGYNTGKIHIQSSYGILNYPGLACDYARAGISLYGVMSHGADIKAKPILKPMLALKARIAEVRWIDAGETVSYGRIFTAEKRMKLATLCIGYADGVPRQMSGNGGMCIVKSCKAPIVGRICMDFIMADVTNVDAVEQGDAATIIGTDGSEEIRCEDVAEASGTITNDILCRLGSRLPRVYIDI